MQASDFLYHRLFSDPVMIEQLVRGFMPARIAALLDFTRLERVNAKFHAARGDRREGDVIWRVPTLAGEMVHIYLLLEFQSTPERFMPVRVQVYSGLLRRLFARRFGALPAGAERLIEDATAEQLDDYMYRLMGARSPDDVFRAWMTGSSPRLSGTVLANQPLGTFLATVFSFSSSSAGLTRGSQGAEAPMLPVKDGRIKSTAVRHDDC